MDTIDDAIARAARHGLRLTADGASANDAGLDYRVVMADDAEGLRWVLRVPRRTDVAEGMQAEARILDLVTAPLATGGVAVPDWQVRADDLIAYPALPGAPGLTLSAAGEPEWHMDPASPDYAERLGTMLARLHAIGADEARAAGVEVRTPSQVRRGWADDIARVREGFTVSPVLLHQWQAWLDDDGCWPRLTTMTHGEIYPAHVLLDPDGTFTAVLDWTTGRVDDPARDLAAQYGAAGEDMLHVTLTAYEQAGGQVHEGMATQARRLWEASPIAHALYALTTRDDEHLAAASAALNPVAER